MAVGDAGAAAVGVAVGVTPESVVAVVVGPAFNMATGVSVGVTVGMIDADAVALAAREPLDVAVGVAATDLVVAGVAVTFADQAGTRVGVINTCPVTQSVIRESGTSFAQDDDVGNGAVESNLFAGAAVPSLVPAEQLVASVRWGDPVDWLPATLRAEAKPSAMDVTAGINRSQGYDPSNPAPGGVCCCACNTAPA